MPRKFPLKIVDDTLKKVFFKLGVVIGKNPGYFIIVPLLLTALCASGFQRMDYNYDPEYLLSPSTGEAKQERAIMEKYFPINYNFFQVFLVDLFICQALLDDFYIDMSRYISKNNKA